MTPFPELARITRYQPRPGSAELRGNGTQAVGEELAGELGWTLPKEGLFIYPASRENTKLWLQCTDTHTKDKLII